jgi:hypothetical protein
MSTKKYELVHSNVFYFPDAIPEISAIMSIVESLDSHAVSGWTAWYSGEDKNSYIYGDLKTLNIQKLAEETNSNIKENSEYVIYSILNSMQDCCKIYMKDHGATQKELEKLEKDIVNENNFYGIRRYNEFESMGPHPDRTHPEADTYTISVYLDDDYDGGELGIVHEGINTYIKPKAGSIVIFPSGYLHESKPLTRGRKTMLTHVHTTEKPIIDL